MKHRNGFNCLVEVSVPWLAAIAIAALTSMPAAHADVIADANAALVNIVRVTSASLVDGPPEVAREIAMVDGAMFDAVNAATGSRYTAMAYAGAAVSGASADAAALMAALSVMKSLYLGAGSPYQQYKGVTGTAFYGAASPYAATLIGPSLAQMDRVAAQIGDLSAELTALGGGAAVVAGAAIGTAAGQATIAARANDNAYAASVGTLTPYVSPGAGQPGAYVTPATRPAMTPTWGAVRPFGVPGLAGLEAAVPPPLPLTSPGYANQVLQTECQGYGTALPSTIMSACAAAGFAPQTAAQSAAALFWNDPGGTAQPPGHWLQIADTVSANQYLDLLDHAREDALVGIALADAGTAVWAVKYQYALWRPTEAIRNCNGWSPVFLTCDPTWSSLIATPPHPDYLAGHPGFSGAAATVLAHFFGTDNVPFVSSSDAYCNTGTATRDAAGTVVGCAAGGVSHTVCNNAPAQYGGVPVSDPAYNASPLICAIAETFSGFSDASSGFLGSEFSRVAGGIHTPAAVENALALGNAVGAAVFVGNLLAVPEPPMLPVLAAAVAVAGLARRRAGGATPGFRP